jgi:L-ascorbate metabolism protein UlaG (beta-lactamase superfamily)
MKITKYIHSCLVVEKGSDRIMFDPGRFSFVEKLVKPSLFQNIRAILLTHFHPDHLDEESLKQIVKNNPNAVILGNTEIVAKLAENGIVAEVFESGQIVVSSFVLEAFDAPHEPLLADELPRNTAYLVDGNILHPGDSLSKNLFGLKNTSILALPMMAPWTTELQVYDFARQMSPQYIVPIHDGFVKDFFLEMRYHNFQKYFAQIDIQFQWMNKPGAYLEV